MKLKFKILFLLVFTLVSAALNRVNAQEKAPDLDHAYSLMRENKLDSANSIFSDYLKLYPSATNIAMQLAYNYKQAGNTEKSLEYFRYVKLRSKDSEEKTRAEKEISYILYTGNTGNYKNNFLDLYSYDAYDSYQQNVIINVITRYNYNFANNFYAGPYFDTYLDTKSEPGNIYNDRYVEAGIFAKYNFFYFLSLEVRGGFVREIDYKESKFNFKPILTFSDKFGDYDDFSGPSKLKSSQNLYFDVYSALLYDHKFENVFFQAKGRQISAFPLSKSLNFEIYIVEQLLLDSKRIDYNNYLEVGGGATLQFRTIYAPAIFVEGTQKSYLQQEKSSSFQIKAGLLFNFYKFL